MDDPYHPPASPVVGSAVAAAGPLRELPIGWGIATAVWWSLIWRALLFGTLAGAVAGFVVGFVLGAVGVPSAHVAVITGWLGMLVGVPVGIWVVRSVLQLSWGGRRLVLVADGR